MTFLVKNVLKKPLLPQKTAELSPDSRISFKGNEKRYDMGQLLKSVEPTIWALRKKGKAEENTVPSLYEHLYGYDPIRVLSESQAASTDAKETIRKGSAQNPNLNIINPATNYAAMEIASDEPSKV